MFLANQKAFVICTRVTSLHSCYTFCTRVTEELHSFLSQSELSNFFVYIIIWCLTLLVITETYSLMTFATFCFAADFYTCDSSTQPPVPSASSWTWPWHGWVSVFVISLRCWIDSIYEFRCKVDRYSIFLRGTQITFDPKAGLVNEGRAWLLRVELLPWILYETSTLFLNFLGSEHVLRTLPLSIVIVAFPR